jgi:DMATS type aromatic prenyltransferase
VERERSHQDGAQAELTVRQACLPRLGGLARSVGLGEQAAAASVALDALAGSWAHLPVSALPTSDVSADGSPVEFAVTLGPGPASVQLAVEPMVTGAANTFAARTAAARATMSRLADVFGLSTESWDAAADIFLPRAGGQGHAAMFGVELGRDDRPLAKLWFYPGVAGPGKAPVLVQAGLRRLGSRAAWAAVVRHAPRGFDLDAPVLFSLDITDGRPGRTKVYFRHYRTGAADLVRQLAGYPGLDDDAAAEFCRALAVSPPGVTAQPPVTCLSFHDGEAEPRDVTLYLPLWTDLPNDEVIRERISDLLVSQGLGAGRYDRALAQVATRPLARARGIHNYLSWQPGEPPRMKVYWSPELRGANPAPRYAREDLP